MKHLYTANYSLNQPKNFWLNRFTSIMLLLLISQYFIGQNADKKTVITNNDTLILIDKNPSNKPSQVSNIDENIKKNELPIDNANASETQVSQIINSIKKTITMLIYNRVYLDTTVIMGINDDGKMTVFNQFTPTRNFLFRTIESIPLGRPFLTIYTYNKQPNVPITIPDSLFCIFDYVKAENRNLLFPWELFTNNTYEETETFEVLIPKAPINIDVIIKDRNLLPYCFFSNTFVQDTKIKLNTEFLFFVADEAYDIKNKLNKINNTIKNTIIHGSFLKIITEDNGAIKKVIRYKNSIPNKEAKNTKPTKVHPLNNDLKSFKQWKSFFYRECRIGYPMPQWVKKLSHITMNTGQNTYYFFVLMKPHNYGICSKKSGAFAFSMCKVSENNIILNRFASNKCCNNHFRGKFE